MLIVRQAGAVAITCIRPGSSKRPSRTYDRAIRKVWTYPFATFRVIVRLVRVYERHWLRHISDSCDTCYIATKVTAVANVTT